MYDNDNYDETTDAANVGGNTADAAASAAGAADAAASAAGAADAAAGAAGAADAAAGAAGAAAAGTGAVVTPNVSAAGADAPTSASATNADAAIGAQANPEQLRDQPSASAPPHNGGRRYGARSDGRQGRQPDGGQQMYYQQGRQPGQQAQQGQQAQYQANPQQPYYQPGSQHGYYRPGAQYYYPGAPAQSGSNKKKMHKGLKALLIGAGILFCLVIVVRVFTPPQQLDYVINNSPFIAKLSVEGEIAAYPSVDILGSISGYYHQWTLEQIDDLINDSNNAGLIIFVNTPGGGVYESDELYLKIKEYKELTERPVYISMGSMAASGGYYISAPADKIFANRNTWTGSIGVTMGTMIDISGFLDEYGVKTTTIDSGVNKSAGSYFEEFTPEQEAIFQGLVDEAYEQFTEIVAEGRGLDLTYTRSISDGRIYTAKQAKELGLIDEIGSYDEALDDMKEAYNFGDIGVKEMYYYDDRSLLSVLLGESGIRQLSGILNAGGGDIKAVLELAERNNGAPIKYKYGD
ncbi:MAG: signal peptide peptidase SppA [Clostridiales Family XIII bacterium]|jgi:protease-4|nr:signal peptide peptidase SppA [Clostridiales Family XIII bacterium]